MTPRWIFNTTDRIWELYVSGRPEPLYNVASTRQPTMIETFRIVRLLRRFYPWLDDQRQEAA